MNAGTKRTASKTAIRPNCPSPDATHKVSGATSGICPIYTYLGCTRDGALLSGIDPPRVDSLFPNTRTRHSPPRGALWVDSEAKAGRRTRLFCCATTCKLSNSAPSEARRTHRCGRLLGLLQMEETMHSFYDFLAGLFLLSLFIVNLICLIVLPI